LCFLVAMAMAVTNAQTQDEFYVDWSTNACVTKDSNHQYWNPIYDSLEDCCAKKYWWMVDECMQMAIPTSTPTPRPTRKRDRPETPSPTKRENPTSTHSPTMRRNPHPTPQPNERNKVDIEIKPIADAFIDRRHPRSNYGSRQFLHVRTKKKGARESLLKFHLYELDKKCIRYATLSLYSLLGSAHSGGTIVTLVPGATRSARRWKENEATWRSIKQNLVQVNRLDIGPVNTDSWVDIDVVEEIKNESYVTFSIVSEGGTAKYASKESKSGNSPKLSITLC